ncbi:MAG: nuclear transport factor 2 family protein [Clostridiaceae bacterium]|nr:nuclear transport factor 2 family protein [Clostridiaceae bacterium]
MEDNIISKRTTMEVLDHHITHLAAGNLEEVVMDYADDAFIVTMNGVVKGKDEIRAFFENNIKNVLPPDSVNIIEKKTVHGEIGYIVWNAVSKYYRFRFGTDTFVIKNGRIVMQTFAGITEKL